MFSKNVTVVLLLANLFLFGVSAVVEISLPGQSSSQSSTYDVNVSPSVKAVDGNTAGDYHAHSCSHTGNDALAWWKVNMGDHKCVGKVIIFNRVDCCEERLVGAIVRVGNNINHNLNAGCGEVTQAMVDAGQQIEFNCDLKGKYISIALQGQNWLHICEVKAYAGNCNNVISLQGQSTFQSSTYSADFSPSDNAVDGNTAGNYHAHSCSHTGNDAGAWWKVDMGGHKCVGKVEIFNRVDCCPERLVGAIVRVGNNVDQNLNAGCGVVTQAMVDAGQKIEFNCDLKGKYISIALQGQNYLQICEVKAYTGNCNKEISLHGQSTSQSSIYSADFSPSDRAVDGNTAGNYNTHSCSVTGNDVGAWWKVDMGDHTCVGRVEIFNRVDCCQDRLVGAIVRVGNNADHSLNAECGEVTQAMVDAGQKIEFNCDLKGKYLSIALQGQNYLQICEVKAYTGICNTDPHPTDPHTCCPLKCPPFWTSFQDNCYRFFGDVKAWADAEEHCNEFFTDQSHGHLVSIHNQAESEFVYTLWHDSLIQSPTLSSSITPFNSIYLGAHDEDEEGTFVWTDGSPFDYNEWGPRQPDNAGGNEDCSHWIDPTYVTATWKPWNDLSCNYQVQLPYVCKLKLD